MSLLLLQVVVKNAHDRAAIEDDCTAKITEYANRGFRGLGIAKAQGDGSGEQPGSRAGAGLPGCGGGVQCWRFAFLACLRVCLLEQAAWV